MLPNNYKQSRTIAVFVIGIFTICTAIYLSFRYIHILAGGIQWLLHLFLPLILGIFFALILNVPLHFFEDVIFHKKSQKKHRKLQRAVSIFLSLLFIFGIVFLILFLVLPKLSEALVPLADVISDGMVLPPEWNFIDFKLEDFIRNLTKEYTSDFPKIITSSFGMAIDFFLGIIFSIYLLSQKEVFLWQLKNILYIWFPSKHLPLLFHIASVCCETFRNFIVGQSIEAVILGTLCTVGMLILQLPFALTIGVLVGVTAFIPFWGAYLGAAIGCILIFTESSFQVLIFLIFLVSLQQIEGNVIYPKVVGHRIDLPSIWVLFSLTIGGRLAGPFGMLLGVPTFSVIYHLAKEATAYKKRNHPV